MDKKSVKISWSCIFFFVFAPHGDRVSAGVVSIEPKFLHFKVSGTLSEAETTCRQLPNGPWSLPAPSSGEDIKSFHRELAVYMESVGLDQAWLPLKNSRLSGWINNEPNKFEGRVQENGDKRKTCGLLKLRYDAAVSEFCESSGYGHVCEIPNCRECPPQVSPHNCIRDGNTCYLLGCDAGSWFEASNRCVAMGTRLAVMKTEQQVVNLVKSIHERRYNPCIHFWTSLVKNRWAFPSNITDSPKLYFWADTQPNHSYDCAVVQKYEDGFYWKSVNCSSKHHFICMKSVISSRKINTFSVAPGVPSQQHNIHTTESHAGGEPVSQKSTESHLAALQMTSSVLIILMSIFVKPSQKWAFATIELKARGSHMMITETTATAVTNECDYSYWVGGRSISTLFPREQGGDGMTSYSIRVKRDIKPF